MKVVFYSNYLNHHQVLVADALYEMLGEEYAFVATLPATDAMLKGGADFSVTKPYCIRAFEGGEQYEKAMTLAREAAVCVFGADAMVYAIERAKAVSADASKLSFEISERWLKRGIINMASPRLLKWLWAYHRYYRKAGFYRLCASAYTMTDDKVLGAYKNRWYKWGYFTEVTEKVESLGFMVYGDNNLKYESQKHETNERPVRLMWCARFLQLKHPELVMEMASRLKEKGYRFHVDVFGDEGNANKREKVFARNDQEAMIAQLGVQDYVTLHGNRPNQEVLDEMTQHDIFLFTSDKLEGWGAVANESMANGCVLVASDAIGSSPYLIKEGYNGFTFKSCDVDSLTEKVEWLLTHPEEMRQMQRNAHKNMQLLWNPQVAAENLMTLIDCLINNRETSIMEGPCSKA